MRWVIAAAVSLLTTVFVGLAALGGFFYWQRVETRGAQAARAALPSLAAKEIPQVLGYDYQTVERSMDEVYPRLTPAYREVFKKQVNKDIIPEARKRHVVSQVDIAGVGVMTAQRDSASLLVYVNSTWTDNTNPNPNPDTNPAVYTGSRVRVDYQRIDGEWLINYIQPI
ncbi:mammalian cell entry protein [Candidatus Mycobacterium wuenschmannii]|uniref:Mammalian cell entry protein n=1 Tax=Candidatus Mycobacterium wuenschmannii TaxID=3027808 RepID=A0ABY8VTY4_9MYCO|nr:mammalian cell entry protein [Candidatus Mycobacterium wuenschmannii]WIM86249.1 mammalian cell entry protein [Candidatus Mycobacterium wuenschmannii]